MNDRNNQDNIIATIRKEPSLAGLPEEVHRQLGRLTDLLIEGQSRINLTAIKNVEGIVRYHLADSLTLSPVISKYSEATNRKNLRIVDIGTGAGFPLLPLAIIHKGIQWFGVESIGKKAAFVQHVAESLQLDNVTVLNDRAEHVATGEMRESFDVMTSRAVGPISSLLEVGLPLLRSGGVALLFKTEAALSEWKQCRDLLTTLGGEADSQHQYQLPGDLQNRLILCSRKSRSTPMKFPRQNGLPFKKPIVPSQSTERKS